MRKTLCLSAILILATLGMAFAPQAVIELNATSFKLGEQFIAVFRLNEPIEQEFTVYAVCVTPKGTMLNVTTLDKALKPVASNVNGLPAGFTATLARPVPKIKGEGMGECEIIVAFFDPSKPITGRPDAFLEASAKYTVTK